MANDSNLVFFLEGFPKADIFFCRYGFCSVFHITFVAYCSTIFSFSLAGFNLGLLFLSGQFLAICPCLLQVKHRPSFHRFSASSSVVVTAQLLLPRFLQLECEQSALVSMVLGSGRGNLTLRRAASWLAVKPPFLPPPLLHPPKSSEIL